jgi:hypothetical protein
MFMGMMTVFFGIGLMTDKVSLVSLKRVKTGEK